MNALIYKTSKQLISKQNINKIYIKEKNCKPYGTFKHVLWRRILRFMYVVHTCDTRRLER